MKGTMIDFLLYLDGNEQLRKDIIEVANKHGFEFDDEVSDAELEVVAGGLLTPAALSNDSVRNKRQEDQTAFENFDQKSNQLFNILSTVMKSMKEMQAGVTRNMN
jgi:hypothetical protein